MATLDHIGLNRYIYMSASVDDMTLGSFDMTEIKNNDASSIIGSSLDDSRLLLGINLYKNGPYGHSSWQQTRMSENPLFRHLRKNNLYPIVKNGKERIYFKGGERFVVTERHGSQLSLDEPAIVSNYKPIGLVGTVDDYNNQGNPYQKRFRKRISMNNNVAYFTNDEINNTAGLIEKDDEAYDVLKNYYLEDNLNSGESPMSSFEKLIFRQTIYPPQQYTYKSYTRARTTFNFNWNSERDSREQSNTSNNFGDTVKQSSVWPLDVDPNWVDRSTPLHQYVGISTLDTSGFQNVLRTKTSSFGVLWNHYSQLCEELIDNINSAVQDPPRPNANYNNNDKLMPAPIYSRRHTFWRKTSVVAPSGLTQLSASDDMNGASIFGGEAFWDTPSQSGKYPFDNSYADFSNEMRVKAKDYTIVPEFRISEHINSFLSSGSLSISDSIFEITGAKADCADSSKDDFYKIYSNSDFLKNFDVVLEDHKDFTDPAKITIKCKGFKKLVPYNGFYPVQRTVNLAEQFYSSYSDSVTVSSASAGWFGLSYGANVSETKHAFQNIVAPLFGPGVLFNSIKSGVAVDYPILVEEMQTHRDSITDIIRNVSFDKRIPFESIVEPEKYLSDFNLICNEPHISGNISSSVFWDGGGDELYSMMANNFVAEVPNFFLKDEKFTTLASSPQSDPNFGQVTRDKEVYTMRIKMYRSMDSANTTVVKHNAAAGSPRYIPPQDIIGSGRKETITMYSRPSAFGPPSRGRTVEALGLEPDPQLVDSGDFKAGSRLGFNFPFTPPYYHGQSWADITFRPTEQRKYTVSEIIASSSVKYYRFDTTCWKDGFAIYSEGGPQQLAKINEQCMHLSASINLFSKGTLGELPESSQQALASLNIQVDDQSLSRWIIQPKFETPILNFTDYAGRDGHTSNVTLPNNPSSASVPIGMWHQYGRVPTEREGIYLQVTEIPRNWAVGRLGTPAGFHGLTGSLSDLCGFSQSPVKLGKVNNRKKISECVVAVPFIENSGVKEFFKLNKKEVKKAINNEQDVETTIVDLVDKIRRFVFPPSFDFVNYSKNVDPIAMYVFEFSHELSQQDLTDIWQNVSPEIGRSHETSQASISHSLIGRKKLINRRKLRKDIRWMVFKVKQRAASRYYDQVFTKKGNRLTDIVSEVSVDSAGPRSKIQYNWPYDFFSLVELVKIDAAIEFSDVETDDEGIERPKPKVAKEENRRKQLNTLFPKR